MNRTYLQAIAILMGTVATTFVATEWRWEPANAGNYLVVVGPGAGAAPDEMTVGTAGRQRPPVSHQLAAELR